MCGIAGAVSPGGVEADTVGAMVSAIRPKNLMREVLSREVLDRKDKIGFRAEPSATWELARENRAAVLENRTVQEGEWFDPDAVGRLLDGGDPLGP